MLYEDGPAVAEVGVALPDQRHPGGAAGIPQLRHPRLPEELGRQPPHRAEAARVPLERDLRGETHEVHLAVIPSFNGERHRDTGQVGVVDAFSRLYLGGLAHVISVELVIAAALGVVLAHGRL